MHYICIPSWHGRPEMMRKKVESEVGHHVLDEFGCHPRLRRGCLQLMLRTRDNSGVLFHFLLVLLWLLVNWFVLAHFTFKRYYF